MSARFPADIREAAVDRFFDGMPQVEVCDWVERVYGRRPALGSLKNWVADRRVGRVSSARYPDADTIARTVARRLTSGLSLKVIAAEFSVAASSPRTWTLRYWPDEQERIHVASMTFDQVYEATMKRVSKDRKVKRANQQHRVEANRNAKTPPRPVDEWLPGPGPGPIPDLDALPDDPEVLKKMLADERDRQVVKDAIIEVLMGDNTQGKDNVRDGELTTATKVAVVVAITDAHGLSIAKACQLVGIAASTFYHHNGKSKRVLAERAARREQYKPLIMQAVAESNQSYGYRRIHAWLQAQGHRVSEKIVRELMGELGCRPPAKRSTKYSSYTGETDHKPANLLLVKPDHICQACTDEQSTQQAQTPEIALSQYFIDNAEAKGLTHDFHADAPWEKIGTDVTEIHCPDGKLFLSAAIDFYDGMPVAVTMSTSPNHELVEEMITRIDAIKPEGAKPIIHSDRGGLYRSTRWVDLITDHDHDNLACQTCQKDQWCPSRWRYIPSLSRKGTSGDNARTEGFFGTMKQELLKGRTHTTQMTVAQMRNYIESYIDFYIHRRLKSTLGNGYTTIAEHRQALSA